MSNPKNQKIAGPTQKPQQKFNPNARRDAEYARWAARANAEKNAKLVGELLENYAAALADGPSYSQQGVRVGENTYAQPSVALVSGVSGASILACGIPGSIDCCDRRHPAKDFIVSGGKVVGLCGKAGFAFRQTRKALMVNQQQVSNLNRIRTFQFQAEAEHVSDHQTGAHSDLRVANCPMCNRPNNRGPRR